MSIFSSQNPYKIGGLLSFLQFNIVLCVVKKESEVKKMPKKGTRVYHRKDGLWEARYVKEIDTSGKKKYGSVYGKTCAEAKEKRQNAEDNLLLYQSTPNHRSITVNRLIEEWLYISRQRLKPSTLQRYELFWSKHIKNTIGTRTVLSCTTIAVHEFAVNLLNEGIASVSANSVLVFLHSCLKYGHREYRLPLPDIVYFPKEEKEMRVLSLEEQQRLETYLTSDMDIYKLGVLLALYTGLRIGELCALEWNDVKIGSISVTKTMQRLQKRKGLGGEIVIGTPKTKTSIRTIPLPPFFLPYLKRFREENNDQLYFLGTKQLPIVEPRVMQYKFKKYMEDLQIEQATFHTLRHTFATRCVDTYNFESKTLSELLGHSSVVITLKKYVHSSFEFKQKSMEKLRLLS